MARPLLTSPCSYPFTTVSRSYYAEPRFFIAPEALGYAGNDP
jgi:hypothetical protein